MVETEPCTDADETDAVTFRAGTFQAVAKPFHWKAWEIYLQLLNVSMSNAI